MIDLLLVFGVKATKAVEDGPSSGCQWAKTWHWSRCLESTTHRTPHSRTGHHMLNFDGVKKIGVFVKKTAFLSKSWVFTKLDLFVFVQKIPQGCYLPHSCYNMPVRATGGLPWSRNSFARPSPVLNLLYSFSGVRVFRISVILRGVGDSLGYLNSPGAYQHVGIPKPRTSSAVFDPNHLTN